MPYTSSATHFLSILTLAGDLFLAALFCVWFFQKITQKQIPLVRPGWDLMTNRGLILAFLTVLAATSGSLFYSEIAGFTPCKLCWFQRVFMYPQVILLGVALWKKVPGVVSYIVPMGVIGGLISIYHYYVQVRAVTAPCSLSGPDCTVKYTFHFGYITIPIMALTAFLLSAIFTYAHSRKLA